MKKLWHGREGSLSYKLIRKDFPFFFCSPSSLTPQVSECYWTSLSNPGSGAWELQYPCISLFLFPSLILKINVSLSPHPPCSHLTFLMASMLWWMGHDFPHCYSVLHSHPSPWNISVLHLHISQCLHPSPQASLLDQSKLRAAVFTCLFESTDWCHVQLKECH